MFKLITVAFFMSSADFLSFFHFFFKIMTEKSLTDSPIGEVDTIRIKNVISCSFL